MKRSFYDMLGLPHDAGQEQIDAAYKLETGKLSSTNVRGAAEAVVASKLMHEGYLILSDPQQRAKYDAKLAAAESGVKLMFFPNDHGARRKLGVESVVLGVLALVFGAVMYFQLSHKMNEVRIEHMQAVAHKQEELAKAVTVDNSQSSSVIYVTDEPKRADGQ